MKKTSIEIKDMLLPALVLFVLMFILPPVLSFLAIGLRQYECFSKVYDNIDYNSIQSSLISITFTILGFAITFRNILIGRDRDKYFGFSMKSIIKYSTKMYSKVCWYIIICLPFIAIISYIFGYRRRIFFYTLLSAICMIIYFYSVLQRTRKDVNNEIVAYMFIDNICDQDKVYHIEYREELFKKLFFDVTLYTEYNFVFDNFLKIFYWIVYENDFKKQCKGLLSKYKVSVIQMKIYDYFRKKNNVELTKSIKVLSLYAFDYYYKIFKCDNVKFSAILIVEQFKLFVENTHIDFTILAKSSILKNHLNHEELYCKSEDETLLRNSNAYIFLFNYLLGLLCAGIAFLSVDEIKKLVSGISEVCENKMVLLSDSKIYALTVLILYYLENSGCLCPIEKEQNYRDLIDYCNNLVMDTTKRDFDFLEQILYADFSVNNSLTRLSEAFNILHKESQVGYGILLNIFDN